MSLLKACNGGSVVAPTVDLTEGLVAHYLLNNNADDSHGTYDGTPSNVDFQGDNSVFNGSTSKVAIPSLGLGAGFTVSFWVYTNNNSVEQRLVGYNNSGENIYFRVAILTTGKLYIYVHSGTTPLSIESTTTISNNTMYQVTVAINENGTGTLFVNSVAENSGVTGSFLFTTTDGMYIGASRIGSNNLNGGISNFRAYSTVKDQTFIDALYAEGYYPKPLPLPTTTGLIAHYPLTGTAEDAWVSHDGTEVGNTYVDDAEFGSVANFNGVDSFIQPPNDYTETSGTIGGWIKGSGIYFGTSYVQSGDTSRLLYMAVSSTAITLRVKNASPLIDVTLTYTATIDTSIWNHIVFSSDGTTTKLHLNGVEVALVGTNNGSWVGDVTDKTHAYIGKTKFSSTSYFYTGKIRDLRRYSTALTTQEILDIYNYEKNFRPIDIDDGLVAYYPLANNSLDNYKSQYDGTDTAMTYDGLSGVFNGTNGGVRLPPSDSLGVGGICSIGGWIRITSYPTTAVGRIIWTGDVDIGLEVNNVTNKFSLGAWDGTNEENVISTFAPTLDVWYHVIGTYSGNAGSLKLYINGELNNESAYTISAPVNYTALSGGIGYNGNTTVKYLNANMSKMRVYNKPITAEQALVIYNTEKGDFI